MLTLGHFGLPYNYAMFEYFLYLLFLFFSGHWCGPIFWLSLRQGIPCIYSISERFVSSYFRYIVSKNVPVMILRVRFWGSLSLAMVRSILKSFNFLIASPSEILSLAVLAISSNGTLST